MKELWAKFKEWWTSLSLREKQAVSIGGSLLTLFIVYQGIWTPLLDHVAIMRNKIASDQKTLVWMQSANKIIQKAENKSTTKNKSLSSVEFLSQMQKQINQAKLDQSLTQLKQSSNDSVEMHFQKVEFDKLIKMIATLIKSYHVLISQMTVTSLDTTGYVNADMVIKQS